MAKVIWTFQALEDIAQIVEFHSPKSEAYATYLVNEFFASEKFLEKFPYLGRVVPESNLQSIRELIVRNYRIIYSVPDSDNIFILAVRHASLPFSDYPIDYN